MSTVKVSLVSIVGKHYGKQDEVSLDNVRFVDCFFDGCHLLYSGGPFLMDNCWLNDCQLTTQSTAAIVLESLQRIGFQISPPVGKIVSGEVH